MQIDTKPIAVVLVRAVSIYLIAMGLSHSTMLLANPGFWEDADTQDKVLVLGALVAPLLVAVILWLSARTLATWMAIEKGSSWVPEEHALVSAGTFLIGVYWAVSAIQALISLFPYGFAKITPWIIVFGVSIGLMLGSKFISTCYGWLRTAGLSHNNRSFQFLEFEVRGVRKVTTGITGLWQPSVHSDVAF